MLFVFTFVHFEEKQDVLSYYGTLTTDIVDELFDDGGSADPT